MRMETAPGERVKMEQNEYQGKSRVRVGTQQGSWTRGDTITLRKQTLSYFLCVKVNVSSV